MSIRELLTLVQHYDSLAAFYLSSSLRSVGVLAGCLLRSETLLYVEWSDDH